ncbi:hypothetical protein GGU10DRAFT_390660 [Lentinula aff. detonsa]|uniref:Uncharacterized protein n=1 Tax=Lentinula aff. detonsa TaxID=2804958 RepID=A0AA38KLU8_9AGAR|nr:hypothetical protein GGU10DRAFT_390660 [Lentinula aff. detonsa]
MLTKTVIAMNDTPLPAFPAIGGDDAIDLSLAIYVPHLSGADLPGRYSSDRLAELGNQALNLTVTQYLFSKQPPLDAEKIAEERESILEEDTILAWLDLYPTEKQRYLARYPNLNRKASEMCLFFLSYIGAVFVSNGMSTHPILASWIGDLILKADIRISIISGDEPSSSAHKSPPPVYISGSSYSLTTPPLTPANSPPSSPSSAGPSPLTRDKTLLLVNQIARQKGVDIQYVDERKGGLDHVPEWVVHCLMDGQEKGCGRGSNKRIAKIQAAREAYMAMGWND